MSTSDLYTQMKKNAEAVQAVVSETDGLDAVFAYAVTLTKDQGGSSVTAPGLSKEDAAALEELCVQSGIEFISRPGRETTVTTALTSADFGIAETGTLAIDSESEPLRIATMLSENHVVWLQETNLVPAMEDIHDHLDEKLKRGAGYYAFITGASRTADIERVLTIGAHGPSTLHILINRGRSS